jgi:hypothetical protein
MTETRYSPGFAAEVCRRMSEGESLRQVCRDTGMPEATVRTWVRDNREDFATQYQAARMLQVESWSDQIIELANRDDLDPADKRVRVDSLKWLMSKLVPKRWGERLLVAGDADSPVQLLHQRVDLAVLSPQQLDALERLADALIAKQG